MSDLFSGIAVTNFSKSLAWYENLLGFSPSFFPHEKEAVWELGDHQYLYIVEKPEHAGHALIMQMRSDLKDFRDNAERRGFKTDNIESFPNNITKITYTDLDGNQISFGGNLNNVPHKDDT